MLLQFLVTRVLLLFVFLGEAAFARRGGGSDSDSSDSTGGSSSGSDDDSSTSGGSGSGGANCADEFSKTGLSSTNLVPLTSLNWTSQSGVYSTSSPTIYDGSYFQGEGTLRYNLTTGPYCKNEKQIRMLGYAWVGPQVPYPVGPSNPFIIGFKTWPSNKDVSDIHTSYQRVLWDDNVCPSDPDLFLIATTRGSSMRDEASDTMDLNVFKSETPDTLDFNATTLTELSPGIVDDEGLFRLHSGGCLSSDTDMHWPETTILHGSITNNTLKLNFTGYVDKNSTQYQSHAGLSDKFKVNFTITFSGQFDDANSTHAVVADHANNTITWVSNTATGISSASWGYVLVWTALIQIITMKLW